MDWQTPLLILSTEMSRFFFFLSMQGPCEKPSGDGKEALLEVRLVKGILWINEFRTLTPATPDIKTEDSQRWDTICSGITHDEGILCKLKGYCKLYIFTSLSTSSYYDKQLGNANPAQSHFCLNLLAIVCAPFSSPFAVFSPFFADPCWLVAAAAAAAAACCCASLSL